MRALQKNTSEMSGGGGKLMNMFGAGLLNKVN